LNRRDCWYALQVRPRFERIAASNLTNRGYEGFLPVYKSRRFWSDRTKTLELPLFPGYIFCRFNAEKRLAVLLAPGVLSIVGIGKIPVAVSEEEIRAIQTITASRLEYGPWRDVCAGQRVRVERGSLAGLEGTIVQIKSDLRLIVALPLIQRSVSVEISRECIGLLPPLFRPEGSRS
jgi:transcription termination/antitermination protein NusG